MNESNPEHNKAQINWDSNGQPVSRHFNDVYFSKASGLKETRHVFLDHNQLPERWRKPLQRNTFTIAETGFGTGLNFLASWALWCTQENRAMNAAASLHFISVEKYPLIKADLQRALALWPELDSFSRELLEYYPPQPASGCHRLFFKRGKVYLTLYFGDAYEGLSQLLPQNTNGTGEPTQHALGQMPLSVDAWFLDGFAPSKNPQMWTASLFNTMACLSHQGTSFATFTAAGAVKRGLIDAGFEIEKVAGFGRKREMLKGVFKPREKTNLQKNDKGLCWHLTPKANTHASKTAIVVGGGLAGSHAAFALAKRGLKLTLLEKGDSLANAASGNRQGVLYTKLSPHDDPLSRFNLAAQLFASNFYHSRESHTESLFALNGSACGVLHLATNEKQVRYYQALAKRYANAQDFCYWLEQQQASSLAGVKVRLPGLFLPGAGWLSPSGLCHALCKHPNIAVRNNSEVNRLAYDTQWHALNAAGEAIATADTLVIASAYDALQFTQTSHLPLRTIRGQVSHLPATNALAKLNTVLCGEGYIAPPKEGQLCLGASFNLNDGNKALSVKDHDHNIENLSMMIDADLPAVNTQQLNGKVGFRTATPDYFPIVGPIADSARLKEQYDGLRYKANQHISGCSPAIKGLFCLLGLGSRGLAYAPLAADVLAGLICGEPLPLHQQLYRHLHPSRFLIRDLSRNKKTSTLNK